LRGLLYQILRGFADGQAVSAALARLGKSGVNLDARGTAADI